MDKEEIMKTMVCITCGKRKSLDYFYKRSDAWYQGECKRCWIKRTTQWIKENPEKRRLSRQRYFSKKHSTLEGRYAGWKSAVEKKRTKTQWEVDLIFIKYLYKKQNGRCFYSGKDLTMEARSEYVISLDRIDSSKGYLKNNVVLCCADINFMKNCLDKQRFINLCNYVSWLHPIKKE